MNLLWARSVKAQSIEETKITIAFKNETLKRALSKVEDLSGFRMAYPSEQIERCPTVSITNERRSVREILELILAHTDLSFKQMDDKIVVYKEDKNPVNKYSAEPVMQVNPDMVIRGKVTDNAGQPLPGVSVKVKGTDQGTRTDAQGNYSLSVPDNATLTFTYIGFIPEEVPVGTRTVIDINLREDNQTLKEVVVTALGIEKSTKSLTYATQNISGAELTKVKDANFMNSLAGKSAGVVITKGSAGPGSSTKVLLRGNKSITGNNQPLYVIDGIPMNNAASNTSSNSLFGSQDFGDAISNLNQEDIESIEILKGASAAALYGSQAANGVILVSTKKGKKGSTKVDFSSTTTFENPIGLPQNQTEYGQKVAGVSNESWGPKISNGSDAHLKDFFNTGKNYLNSLSISTGNSTGQVYMSYANTKANGIVPENDLTKHNINLRGTAQVFDNKLSLDGSINYINQMVHNRPQSGYYLSPIFSLYLFPTGDDFSRYSGSNFELWDPVRLLNKQNWPYIVNEASSNQNPYWIQNRDQNDLFRERTISAFSARYLITDWLNVQGRITYDRVQDSYEQRLYATTDVVLASANGAYTKNTSNTNQLYSDLLVSGSKSFGDVSLSATLGYSFTKNKNYGIGLSSVTSSGLAYPNFFSVYGLKFPFNSSENLLRSLSQAVFGTATIGYKDRLYLDLTGRNEWSSTVANDFFYPSVGLSYILADGSGQTDILSFAKIRGSYSEVGNALPFGVANLNPSYSLSNDDNINPRGALPYFSGTDTVRLKPERTRSYEFGTELRFFKDKLSLNFTYYNATTYDQVFTIGAPAGSGASNFYINGGTIRNKGFEGILTYNASFGNLKWSPSVNFSHNKNQIIELSNLLTTPRFVLTDINSTRQVQLFLTKPQNGQYGSYGDLFGKKIQYNTDGSVKTDAAGLPVLSANPDEYIGNANPDFLAGFNNRFTYNRFSLSFLVDGRFGGKIFSVTETWRDWKGLSERTAAARNSGGVMVNDKLVDAEAYYKRISGSGQQGAAEKYVFDATNVRLREISLGYTIPKIGKAVKDLNISLVGRNVFFFYKKAPFDPEVSIAPSNGLQGIEGFNLPSTRSYGLSLRTSF